MEKQIEIDNIIKSGYPLKRRAGRIKKQIEFLAAILIAILSAFQCVNVSAQYTKRLQDTLFLKKEIKDTLSRSKDSVHQLSTVTITAFQGRGDGTDIAASVFLINKEQLQFTDKSSLLSSFNTAPGVRLEERSPGSLRLSVRGSLLRSPYGVRGIKFYMDGIPLTDAGGNTYLQSLSPEQLQSAEIIKGPAGSLYGAGTGGAVLLHLPEGFTDSSFNKLFFSYTAGNYGRVNPVASWEYAGKKIHTYISASHFYSKGDRAQDTARKSIMNYVTKFKISNKLQLNLTGFYSDLHYQTPGGITKTQLGTDTTAYTLAVLQKAGVSNQTIFWGASLRSRLNNYINNETSILWSHTNFENPFTNNYEKRKENNYGGRSTFSLHGNNTASHWQLLAGLEWISGKSHIDNFGNDHGVPDTVQYKDRLNLQRESFFMQFGIDLGSQNRWHLQAGISTNQQKLRYRRLTDLSQTKDEVSNTDYLWSPKIGLTYQLLRSLALYATESRGFSTPTLAEVHPSDGRFDQLLQAEGGWNIEAGIRGHTFNDQLNFEGSLYSFNLKNAIVRRTDKDDIEYYVNAGATRQKGAELWLSYRFFDDAHKDNWISQVQISSSISYQPYHFLEYQEDDKNYNGHPLTGVPKNIAVFTLDVKSKTGLYLHSMLNATGSIPLNDATSVYADAYQLLQTKIGYQVNLHKSVMELYLGIDNILNQIYSLGNDINAYGGRYFNPAPRRNLYTGIQLSL